MEQHELLRHAAETLDKLNIPYFVTGSFAGVLYGEYRMTNDIDIVVDLKMDLLDAFLGAFAPDIFYADRGAAVMAIRSKFQFNVIHKESLTKIDIIVSPLDSHDRETLRRVMRFRAAADYDIAYISPEDLLLKKLAFHKQSGSEKHLRDCAGILRKSGPSLDMDYLEKWSDWLDVHKSWQSAKKLADESP